jgi:hypothetical protein
LGAGFGERAWGFSPELALHFLNDVNRRRSDESTRELKMMQAAFGGKR